MKINTSFTRIVRLDECVGKTIAGFVEEYGNTFGLRFADGTYLYVEATCYDGDSDNVNITFRHGEFDDAHEPFNLGIIDEAERDRISADAIARQEDIDRQRYEALKAKFEKGPDPT